MANLTIEKCNEVYLKITTEPHIEYELRDHFRFEVPNAKFMPQYRKRNWNGEIHLFDMRTKRLYIGLLHRLVEFCSNYNYTYEFITNKYYGKPFEINKEISLEGVKDYLSSITALTPRSYQIEAVHDALKYNRKILLSPTASGKSLMIYAVVRYHMDKNRKILVVVPTTSLVDQLVSDFRDYGWNSESYCHKIYAGCEKETDLPVTVTTWQSIYKMDRSYFEDFDVVIGDEAHLFKSKSLITIMTHLHHTKYRYGFTGTLDGTQTHKWVLEGLFEIRCLILKHDPRKFETYEDEIQYLITHERRNKFIVNLAKDLKGNTLILYSRVAAHGEPLFEKINSSVDENRKVFFVHGGVDSDEREEVRRITENESNAIIVASYGTFSTGINIRNLHNVIFASPSKSRIRNLQSIGRVLRKGKNKTKATLYDIADDCTIRSLKNYTLNHLIERIKIYNQENFNYDILNINLKE
jgi:superfamily II DNA or RNA helicase